MNSGGVGVNTAPAITSNPVSQSVVAGNSVSFTAAATGAPTPTAQWQVSSDGGATFSNLSAATSTTLSFTAAASQNGNQYRAVFTNTSGSATTSAASLTVKQPSAVLTGQYAFELSGFDLAGYPMALVGSITADGQGHITTGSVDVNDFGQLTFSNAVRGTYTLDSNYRGLLIINGGVPAALIFNFTLKADGTLADLIESNQNNQTFFFTTGRMQKQDRTAFSLSSLAGSYSFLLESNMQCRRSSVGRFTLNANGTTTNGLVDISNGGIGSILTNAGLSANFATAGPDANGRGSLSMVDSDASTTYAYYTVSGDELLLIETDPGNSINCGGALPITIYSGMAAKQSFALSPTAVNSAGSVFWLTGLNAADESTASIGVLQISSGNTATVQWDTNNNDTFFGPMSVSGAPVNFDPNTGRGTISVTNGSAQGLFDQAAFYLVDSGTAFLLEATAGSGKQALAGMMEPQIGIGNFGASTIAGNMIGGTTTGNSSNNVQTFDLLFTAQSNGTISSIQDFNNRGCDPTLTPPPACTPDVSGFHSNVTVSSIAISGVDATTGRGVLTTPNPNGGSPAKEILYLIGPSHFVFIDETLYPPNVFTPIWGFTPIFRFDPQ